MSVNPLLEDWSAPYGAPPFDRIAPEHFRDAYERALADHRREIASIAKAIEPVSFDNTIAALERSGKLLARVESVFSNLASADTNDKLQTIERELAPILARHWNEIYLDAGLFAGSTSWLRGAERSASTPKRCGCSNVSISISCAPARSWIAKTRPSFRD